MGLDPTKRQKEKVWHVYILECNDGRMYTGITMDLDRRMKEHSTGKGGRFTRSFGMKKLLYQELHATRQLALKREAQIKTWTSEKKRDLMKSRAITRHEPIIQKNP